MMLNLPVQYLKGVGPKRAQCLKQLGVERLEDLLFFAPFRYEDRTALQSIGSLLPGMPQTLLAEVKAVSLCETRIQRMKIVDVTVADNTGRLHVKWFNQSYLAEQFKKGDWILLSGDGLPIGACSGGARPGSCVIPECLHRESSDFRSTPPAFPLSRE